MTPEQNSPDAGVAAAAPPPLRSMKLEFPGSQGAALSGRLELPEGAPRAYALFAHCFTCTKESFAASRISKALTAYGIAVLRFDFTGLGGSDGDFANTNFSSNVDDIVRACAFLTENHGAPTLLVGHSLGGAAVLAAVGRIEGIAAVATIGAPSDPSHVAGLFAENEEEIRTRGEAEVRLGERPFRIRRQFLIDISEQPQQERIRHLDAALLVLHSPVDQIVGIESARRIFESARHPKSFIALDGADHLLTDPVDAAFAASVVATWATRYTGTSGASDVAPVEATATSATPLRSGENGLVIVSENGQGSYGQDVLAGTHALLADEPEGIGHDLGPSPYEFLLSGLGACTSMTLRMYADRKGWPLTRVTVALRHAKIDAAECEDCETDTGKVDEIQCLVTLEGDLTAEQREGLLAIAGKCPVHRTLRSETKIRTSLAAE